MNTTVSTQRTFGSERGIALMTVMLLLLLTSSVLVGFLTTTSTDLKIRAVDRTRTKALYAAHAGLEKLTSDLAELFAEDFAPRPEDFEEIQAETPALADITYDASDGLGYKIGYDVDDDGGPVTKNGYVKDGPYAGFIGLITPYTLTVTARTGEGSEARVQRTLQTVAIPVFQFGIFSETDLSYFPGPAFNFGGRVHTNSNLFLASGAELKLADKVTVLKDIVRTNLSNGWPVSSGYTGSVKPITAPGAFRAMTTAEGSLVGTIGTAATPNWTDISIGTYNGNVRTGKTGAKRLDLPLIDLGLTPIDLIKRPPAGEDEARTKERMYYKASVRILLSDTAAEITSLPFVSLGDPVPLERLATTPIVGYAATGTPGTVANPTPNLPRLAVSTGLATDGYRTPLNTPLHGGFLKIEYRDEDTDEWNDVTVEILNLGFARRNLDRNCVDWEPNPNAIIRIQRIKQTPSTGANCGTVAGVWGAAALPDTDYWPLVMFDAREGWQRDNHSNVVNGDNGMHMSGIMHYIDLDVRNLKRWLDGTIGANGDSAANEDGYLVYFSDRRSNKNLAGVETGEFGWEDNINRGNSEGWPDGGLETGEDYNGNNVPDNYGNTPRPPAGATAPLNAGANLNLDLVNGAGNDSALNRARSNRAIFFRRALKLTNGTRGNLPVDGLTVASENPVYVQGNYNADGTGFSGTHSAAAVMADAVTLLSNNWDVSIDFGVDGVWRHGDTRSMRFPWVLAPTTESTKRPATTTWYRMAIIAGKGLSFPHIGGQYQDFGTDGGVHNFLRYLEHWGGATLNYRGSIISLYTSRQATGVYKCCRTVYSPPTRGYNFDTDFLDPDLLPPKTPMFRDINTTGFRHITRRQ